MQKTQSKILLIRFSSIGDIVLTTPVIRALHQQLNAEVHLLTKRSFSGVLSANPYIKQIWSIDEKVSEVLPQLKKQKFTAIIDLHVNLRTWQVRFGLFNSPFYRFNKLNWQKWLLTKFKINHLPKIHIVDRYLAAAKPLGIKNDGQGLDHFIPEEDEVNPIDFGLKSPYVALVTGAAHATKRLPIEKLVEICKKIPQQVVLLGGPDEKKQGEIIAKTAGNHVVNVCGHTRLQQSASLLKQASCVITHDTGLMHIAAAFQLPIISIWGNTVPEFGMYPYLPQTTKEPTIFEVNNLNCRPCSKIGYNECPKGHFNCMQQQNTEAIAKMCTTNYTN